MAYARVVDGVVVEIIEPMLDGSGKEIPISDRFHADYCAQIVDIDDRTDIAEGWSYDGSSFAAPPAPPGPTAAQAAAEALAAGLTVHSTATPALDGTYAVDTLSQMHIVAIETSITAGKGFPGGSSTFGYPDVTGALHTFSESDFTNFAAAVRDYVYQLGAVQSGASTTLPPATMNIA